jgi:hypothetical protein
VLHLDNCSLTSLAGLEATNKLRQLRLSNCCRIQTVAGLEFLRFLASLEVLHCDAVQQLHLCSSLKVLRVQHCGAVTSISGLASQLTCPRVEGCSKLEKAAGSNALAQLVALRLCGCSMRAVRPAYMSPEAVHAMAVCLDQLLDRL